MSSYVSASDLYDVIKGGTQRANAWAGILQEDVEKDFKNQSGMQSAYDVIDACQLTSGNLYMYEFVESNVPEFTQK